MVEALHFESSRHIEKELIKICVDLFRGSNTEDKICGLITSGGTESILFAMLSYLKMGRDRGITEPEM